MDKVVSFENIVKLTKSMKVIKVLLFEDYQRKVLKCCEFPKSKDTNSEHDFKSYIELIEINSSNPINNKILNNLRIREHINKN
jgi:hypothetical protein